MELKKRIEEKRKMFEVGSKEYLTLTEVLLELDGTRIHRETEEVCESCQ